MVLPRLQVQVPGEEVPEVEEVRPMTQRKQGRRIARPDWSKLLG